MSGESLDRSTPCGALRLRAARPSEPRALFLSPAAATFVFFAARVFIGLGTEPESSAVSLAGASGRAEATRVQVAIPSVEQTKTRSHRVPPTESELLELLRRDGTVLFTSEDVEAVEVPAQEFTLEEVGVITVDLD